MSEHAVSHVHRLSSNLAEIGRLHHIVSSPEPKAQRCAYSIPMVPAASVVRPSIVSPSSSVHNAQRSSSPKPLGRSKPNFMWSLLG